MMAKSGIEFPLVEAPGEAVPLPDQSFDLAVSEYGASLWADPYNGCRKPPAAAAGRAGSSSSPTRPSCSSRAPDTRMHMVGRELLRNMFGMYRMQWEGATGIEYHLAHGDWIKLLRANGFEIEALHELRPQPEAPSIRPTTTSSRSSGRRSGPQRRSG